jgi:HEAT repeat protein
MAIQVTCPTCQSKYQLGDAVQGKNIRCKKCGEIFRIASASAPAAPAVIHPVMPSADIRSGIQPPPIGPHSPLAYAEPVRSEESYVDAAPARGSSTLKILLVVFGSLAAVGVVTCGGIILLGYRATQAAKEKFEEIQAHVEANDPGAAVDLSTKPPANLDEALEYVTAGSASKRHAGAQWLARSSRDAGRQEEVARHLLPLLSDSNSQVRLAGGRALEKWATRQSVPALLDVLKDEDGAAAELRQTAIRTLGRLRDDRAAGPLAQRLTHFFDREHAARALEDMGPMAESAVVKFFHHPDNAARESARRILQSYHTKEDVILSQSIQDLKGPDFDSRKIVAMWLCQTPVNEARRREVAEGLTLLLTDGRPDVRLAGLKALGIWGTSNDVPAMIRAVDDDSNDVRQLAMQTLVQLKDPRGVDAIAGRLTNFFDRDQATRALQDAGPAAEKAVVRYYHHKDREVRERARRLLKEYNTKLSVILEQTVVDLKSPENEMRVSCAEWFASQAPVEEDRKAVADALDKLLTDMDQGVRLAGMKALRKWATKDNVPALVEVVKDDAFTIQAGELRKLAMQTLGELKDERGAPIVAARLRNFFEREEAARALVAMGPIVEKYVILGLTEPDPVVRQLVCGILAEVGTKASVTALRRTARGDRDGNVAAAALLAANTITARIAAVEKKGKESKTDSVPAKDTKPEKPADKTVPPK